MGRKITKAKHMSYRVHTTGPRTSGKPVSAWFMTRSSAEKWALKRSKKTGRKYIILARVSGVV